MARIPFAETIPAIELGAYQRALRALLLHPLLTPKVAKGQALKAVRRFAPQLQSDLEALGYGFHLGASAARLLKPSEGFGTQGAQGIHNTKRARPFDRRRYALLCLALAALEQSHEQTTLTDLAQQVRSQSESLLDDPFDPDVHHDRRAFVDAIAQLEEAEVLTLTDGSSDAWSRTTGEGEALYDIDRHRARDLFRPPLPLPHMGAIERLFSTTPETLGISAKQRRTRERLLRWILERPALYHVDLSESDRAYLEREGRAMGEELERLTGCTLERTKEGVALIDVGVGFSDRPFPSTGSQAQCALLLIDRIQARLKEGPPFDTVPAPSKQRSSTQIAADLNNTIPESFRADAESEDPPLVSPLPPQVQLPFAPESWCLEQAKAILEAHASVLSAAVAQSPDHLLKAALRTLIAHDLMRPIPGGVVLMPAMGRYRRVQLKRTGATLSLFDTLPKRSG